MTRGSATQTRTFDYDTNGQSSSAVNPETGTVTYSYTSYGRLEYKIDAKNQKVAYTYDGFGNLTAKTVTKGSAPTLSVAADMNTNRIVGQYYDANGNLKPFSSGEYYDIENRLQTWDNNTFYAYGADNKRVMKRWTQSGTVYEDYSFWGLNGKVLGVYRVTWNGSVLTFVDQSKKVYFGSRELAAPTSGGRKAFDRLGSVVQDGTTVRSYCPYGEDRSNSTEYATYPKDTESGLKYADQRYYNSSLGRFLTPDESGLNEELTNPGSLNLYAYVNGDPANFSDPTGQGLLTWVNKIFSTVKAVVTFGGPFAGVPLGWPSIPSPPGSVAAGELGFNPPGGGPPIPIPKIEILTKEQQKMFEKAATDALERLSKNKDCLKLIGDNAFDVFRNTKFGWGAIPTSPETVAGSGTYAAADPDEKTITINGIGKFFYMREDTIESVNGIRTRVPIENRIFTSLSDDANRTLVLLHELAHLTGKLGDDRQDHQLSDTFNANILRDCFGKK